MKADGAIVSYVLDAETRLIAVGGAWDRFAIDNGAPELLPPQPLGRPLRSFISDRTTAHLYDEIFAKAKKTGAPITFPIRCDSPTLRRRLGITVRHDGARFLVSSVLLSAEPRTAMPVGVGRRSPAAGDALVACSWCKRVSADGAWVEIEEALERLKIFEAERVSDISHGMCEACVEEMEGVLATT